MPGSKAKVPYPDNLEECDVTQGKYDSWEHKLLTYLRTNDDYLQFFPNEDAEVWKPLAEDKRRGIEAEYAYEEGMDAAAKAEVKNAADTAARKKRLDLEALLCTIATYAPSGLYKTIVSESESLDWIWSRIKDAFNLNSSGQHFLNVLDIQYKPGESYDLFFLRLRAFYQNGLLQMGESFMGKILHKDDFLNPLSENLITKEWLSLIDPRLPKHVRDTRSHLFDGGKQLGCVQRTLANSIDKMLQELDGSEDVHRISAEVKRIYIDPQNKRFNGSARSRGFNRGFDRGNRGHNDRGSRGYGGFDRGYRSNRSRGYHHGGQTFQKKTCMWCMKSGQPRNVYESHTTSFCNTRPTVRQITFEDDEFHDENYHGDQDESYYEEDYGHRFEEVQEETDPSS